MYIRLHFKEWHSAHTKIVFSIFQKCLWRIICLKYPERIRPWNTREQESKWPPRCSGCGTNTHISWPTIGDIWQQRLVAWLTKEMCSALKRALIRIWRAGMQANIDLHYSVQCVWRILIISKTLTGIQMQMHTIQYKIATDRSPINTAIGTIRRIRLLLLANIESKYTHTVYGLHVRPMECFVTVCSFAFTHIDLPTSSRNIVYTRPGRSDTIHLFYYLNRREN